MKVVLKIKATVTDVTDWYEDDYEYAGTALHIGDHETLGLLYNEQEEKRESDKWCREHLPAVFEIVGDEPIWIDDEEYAAMFNKDGNLDYSLFAEYIDEDEVENGIIDIMTDSEKYCYGDLLKPENIEFDSEVIGIETVNEGE